MCVLRVLGGEFYKEITEITGKEAKIALKGVWLGELSELHAFSRAELAHIKAFISAVADPYVPKYENDGIVQARRCVLAGTTNEEIYLKTTTGNTRFFPVKCRGLIDYEGLEGIRDQLFAEALVQYEKHKKDWWKIPDAAKEELIQLRKEKQDPNIYDDLVRRYLAGKDMTTLEEVFAVELQLEAKEKWKDKALQMQVSDAIKNAGWERATVNNVRSWVGPTHKQHSQYKAPPPPGAVSARSRCPVAPNGRHDPWTKAGVVTCFQCDAPLTT
jgi:putative DNA primase/helicase